MNGIQMLGVTLMVIGACGAGFGVSALFYSRRLGALQARIDALMLEYCPDEMTSEQFNEWARNQRVVHAPKPDIKLNEAGNNCDGLR